MTAAEQPVAQSTVLIVDDEPGMRRSCARMLEASGFDVLTAGSAEEALGLFDEHVERIALVLVDLVLSGMTGPELATRLRDRRRGIKVVFMSGHEASEIGELGVIERDAHFLGKPFSAEVLTSKVRDVLGGAASSGS